MPARYGWVMRYEKILVEDSEKYFDLFDPDLYNPREWAKMAKAAAYLQGRNYVIPADVMDVFEDVAIHRIILNMKAKVGHIRTEELIRRIVEQVRQPSLQKRR